MKNFYKNFSIVIISLFLVNTPLLHAQTRLADSLTLVALYTNNGGATWTNNTNWLSATQPIDTWYGIHVTGGRVDSISLSNNNLTSAFPTTVTDVTALVKFDVSHNALTGSLPYLTSTTLLILDVSFNQITGTLNYYPTPNLQVMRINNNQLSGDIASLNFYDSLVVLNASNNAFTGSMPYFQSVNFDTINVSYNQLSGTINYYPVQKLRYFNGSHNAFTGNANAIPFPAKEEIVDYSYNQLTGSLPYFTSTSLKWLNLSHNQFSGTMNYSKVPHLTYIDVSYNQLTGPPDPITDATSYSGILYIHMSHNQFTTGQYGLPYFNSATLYDSIDLSYNNLTGPIGYYTFPSCVYYNLSNNQLSGALPNFSGYAANVDLDISHNKFTFNELEPQYNNLPAKRTYAPQDTLVLLTYTAPKLITSFGGGTLAKDTFAYYRSPNILDTTIAGDSTFTPSLNGSYTVWVTNSVVTGLTLGSDTVTITTLPVTLGSFTASLKGDGKAQFAQLNWSTYTEINNDHFDIERKTDDITWQIAGTVQSKAPGGNSSLALQYTFDDHSLPASNVLYYRLKQVDKDGKFQYSNVIKLNTGSISGLTIKVLPNIVSGSFNIALNSPASQQVAIRIISTSGAVIYTKENVWLQPGNNTVTVNNFEGHAAGIYHIEVLNGDTRSSIGSYKILKN